MVNHTGYSSSQVRRQFRQSFQITPSAYREKKTVRTGGCIVSPYASQYSANCDMLWVS
nr:helix-turn-helix transcriptional regulator [Halomonas glaciei]